MYIYSHYNIYSDNIYSHYNVKHIYSEWLREKAMPNRERCALRFL